MKKFKTYSPYPKSGFNTRQDLPCGVCRFFRLWRKKSPAARQTYVCRAAGLGGEVRGKGLVSP